MSLLDIIFPPVCLGCKEPIHYRSGAKIPFCKVCLAKWEAEKLSLTGKYNGIPLYTVMPEPDEPEKTVQIAYLNEYHSNYDSSLTNVLVLSNKSMRTVHIRDFVAGELAGLIYGQYGSFITEHSGETVLTFIPRSKRNIRRAGYDHMKPVAAMTAEKLGISFAPLLSRSTAARSQKLLSARDRFKNAQASISFNGNYEINGKTVILVDDVITTGATLFSACEMLKNAGARAVIPFALAKSVNND